MAFICKQREKYYLAQRIKKNSKWINKIIRRATPAEIKAYQSTRGLATDLAPVTCAYPECDKVVLIPRTQKRKFMTTYPLRYNRLVQVYCSQECQDNHGKLLEKITNNANTGTETSCEGGEGMYRSL
ncbi:Uncharacterised protein [uncultured archaeon]|nr:Uncharacterised protein [uncultured archaeon]